MGAARWTSLAERRRAQSLPDWVQVVGSSHKEKEQQVGGQGAPFALPTAAIAALLLAVSLYCTGLACCVIHGRMHADCDGEIYLQITAALAVVTAPCVIPIIRVLCVPDYAATASCASCVCGSACQPQVGNAVPYLLQLRWQQHCGRRQQGSQGAALPS
jgi:hypothetical protein